VSPKKTTSNARRDAPKPQPGKGGGLMTGLFIGLIIGLVAAAGLAWYFNNRGATFKAADEATPPKAKTEKPTRVVPPPPVEPSPAEASAPPQPKPEVAPKSANDSAPSKAKPRVDYTFYGILPGDKPAKPTLPTLPPPKSSEIWWLQVAALKNPTDADKLKARLALLGLQVAMQKVDSGGTPLYRIRTGPYKREDDALGDLDTLAANNFEPRLFKEPNTPPASPKTQEKP
jgi:cell division protein FtsN